MDQTAIALRRFDYHLVEGVSRFSDPDDMVEHLTVLDMYINAANAHQSGLRSSRAIRLDVSQRAPPIACTSA